MGSSIKKEQKMELTDLVGEHVLSGVDRGSALDEYEF